MAERPAQTTMTPSPLTVIDRFGNALDHQAQRRSDRIGAWSETASRSLARAAGVVERAPFLQRGEDASTRQRGAVDQ